MNERVQGMWQLSDETDNEVSGDLFIDGAKLELNGTFEKLKNGTSFGSKPKLIRPNETKTILGITKGGAQKYTLEFFDNPTFTMNTSGYKADTYSLGTIFEGGHFKTPSDILFNRYYIDIPYLLEWVDESVIKPSMVINTAEKPNIKNTTINIDSPLTIEFYSGKKFRLSFVVIAHGVTVSHLVKSMKLRQSCRLKIEAVKKPLSIAEMHTIATHFERFLIIATGKGLRATAYEATSDELFRTINIYPRSPEQKDYKDIDLCDMNFAFSDIREASQTIFEKWYSDMDKHVDVFDLFSNIRSGSTKNLNNQFKDIVSAIEGYVAIEYDIHEPSPSSATKILNEMLPKDSRPFSKDDYDKIRITRNKLSHIVIKPVDEKYVMGVDDKWLAFHKLLFLLEYSFLKSLGAQEELLEDFCKKCIWLHR